MSKSLGNGIDPLEVVDLLGADAMRFTIVNQCAIGTDIYLDHEDVEGAFSNGRNFANKIWNAGRFALLSIGDGPVHPVSEVADDLELADRWILARLNHATAACTRDLERFRLHEVAENLYHFFWGEVCDWYLELVKDRLDEDADAATREAARSTLVTVLDRALRLLHPIVPFVTTELWARLPWPHETRRPDDLIVAPWPEEIEGWRDPEAEASMAALQELIQEVRRLRKEYGVGEGRMVTIHLDADDGALPAAASHASALRRLARVGSVETGSGNGIGAHAVLSGGAELFLPLEGVIDLERERARLAGEIERLQGQLAGAEKKLANEQFVTKAPDAVVQKERDKAAGLAEQVEKLRAKAEELGGAA
jgi:valyl-tRNA synthetase